MRQDEVGVGDAVLVGEDEVVGGGVGYGEVEDTAFLEAVVWLPDVVYGEYVVVE